MLSVKVMCRSYGANLKRNNEYYKDFVPTGLNMPNLSQIYNIKLSYHKAFAPTELGIVLNQFTTKMSSLRDFNYISLRILLILMCWLFNNLAP